jgi:AAA domain (dynein-related subfamily)
MKKEPAGARAVPASIDDTLKLLGEADYLADRSLATVLFLALRMGRPLFLEGEAGVGKTEIAKVLSQTLGRRLIRLQCYEGLDVSAAVYEWNYAEQMIAIRLAEAEGNVDRERLSHDVFSERFLIKRPLLQALEPDVNGAPVLLIDELDRTDEAFEAFLLEVLADNQVTIPEMGTVKAEHPPITIITSNRTRLRSCVLRCRAFPRSFQPRSCTSCRRCASRICSSRRASRSRSIGRRRSPSSMWWRSIPRPSRTHSAFCSSIRTTSRASKAPRRRNCSTRCTRS